MARNLAKLGVARDGNASESVQTSLGVGAAQRDMTQYDITGVSVTSVPATANFEDVLNLNLDNSGGTYKSELWRTANWDIVDVSNCSVGQNSATQIGVTCNTVGTAAFRIRWKDVFNYARLGDYVYSSLYEITVTSAASWHTRYTESNPSLPTISPYDVQEYLGAGTYRIQSNYVAQYWLDYQYLPCDVLCTITLTDTYVWNTNIAMGATLDMTGIGELYIYTVEYYPDTSIGGSEWVITNPDSGTGWIEQYY